MQKLWGKIPLGDVYVIFFMCKMRIVKPNREFWRLDIATLVKCLAQFLACGKWLVRLLLCVKALCKCWYCISVSCSKVPGRKQPGREADLKRLEMNPKRDLESRVICKCSPTSGLKLRKGSSWVRPRPANSCFFPSIEGPNSELRCWWRTSWVRFTRRRKCPAGCLLGRSCSHDRLYLEDKV